MNIQLKDITPVKKELHVEVPYQDLLPHFEKAYKKFQQTAKVPGFRPGKVPMSMIVSMYGTSIQYNELEKIAQTFFRDAIKEKNIEPIARPSMKAINYQPEQPLTFMVAYDVRPEVKLGNYKKGKYQTINAEVTDDDVEKELDYIRTMRSKVVDTQGPTTSDDILVLSVEELDEKGEPNGKQLKDKVFRKNSEEFSDADKALLVGKSIGDIVKVSVLDSDKTRPVQVTIKSIHRFEAPELTDEFIKELTGDKYQSASEYKTVLKEYLSKDRLDRKTQFLEEFVILSLIKQINIEIPESLVEMILDNMIQDVAHKQKDHKLPADFNEVEYRNTNRKMAENTARWSLIKDTIITEEKLIISQEDLDAELKAMSERDKLPFDALKRAYQKPDAKANLETKLLNKKVFELITAQATITEVPVADFKLPE